MMRLIEWERGVNSVESMLCDHLHSPLVALILDYTVCPQSLFCAIREAPLFETTFGAAAIYAKANGPVCIGPSGFIFYICRSNCKASWLQAQDPSTSGTLVFVRDSEMDSCAQDCGVMEAWVHNVVGEVDLTIFILCLP
jgi:hypothetical protein